MFHHSPKIPRSAQLLLREIEDDIRKRFYADVELAVIDVEVRRVMRGSVFDALSLRHSADLKIESRDVLMKVGKVFGTGNPLSLANIFLTGRLLERWQHLLNKCSIVER